MLLSLRHGTVILHGFRPKVDRVDTSPFGEESWTKALHTSAHHSPHVDAHLSTIDAAAWPRVATVPQLAFAAARARRAEAAFARACAAANITVGGPEADMQILQDALFLRLADAGWLGLAEGYMAGEWTTPDSSRLVNVLSRLVQTGFAPKTPSQNGACDGGELPADLVSLYAADGLTDHGGIFASGVPTTVRETIQSFAAEGGRLTPGGSRGAAKTHFVDVSTYSAPTAVEREDLDAAQTRAAAKLADAANLHAGAHVLVSPAAGVRVGVEALRAHAIVDVVTADPDAFRALQEHLILSGADHEIRGALLDSPLVGPHSWRGRYDAIINVDQFHTLSPAQRRQFFAGADRLMAPDGTFVMLTTCARVELTPAARAALAPVAAYVWPGLDYPAQLDVHRTVEKHSGLRIIAEQHAGAHTAESLRQQRSFFDGRLREAAAAGFDPVYRRLWTYQLAVREALAAAGFIESVQFTARRRRRTGR